MGTANVTPAVNPAAPAAVPAGGDYTDWSKLTDEQRDAASSAPAPAAAEPAAKTPPASDPDDDDVDEEKLPKGLKKRFKKLTEKIRDLEARKPTAAPGEVTDPAKPKPVEATPAPADKPKPKEEDFPNSYADFVEALTDWKAEQRELTKTKTDEEKTAKDEAKTKAESWTKDLQAAREKYSDFDEVALSGETPINEHTHNTILALGAKGTELAYWLGQNREEAVRISKLTPEQTGVELGMILAQFAGDKETPKAAVSKAPRPAKPISGAADTGLGKEPDPSDYPKWSAWNAKREALEAGD